MAMGSRLEINCDMGEGFGRWKLGPDEELMEHVDVANIACGFHAGDHSIMVKTVRLAKQHNVRVGAHPGMPDLFGFGRRQMNIPPDDMYALVLYQIGALDGILRAEGMRLNHVKPHGEMYFYVQRDPDVLEAVLRAVKVFDVPIYGLPTSTMKSACQRSGVKLIPEFYPDIDYDEEGNLVPVMKSQPATPELISRRVTMFGLDHQVVTSAGTTVELGCADESFSVCIHSDLPGALENAAAARKAVEAVYQKQQQGGG